jgi:hypothetical protein
MRWIPHSRSGARGSVEGVTDALAPDQLVGRRIVDVRLDEVRDGYVVLVLDDGTSLEIRTSKVGHLLLSRRPT